VQDIEGIISALETLETRTIVRFGELQEAVAIMATKVAVLEKKLTADLENDAASMAAAQEQQQEQRFFTQVRGMAKAVTHLHDEQQHAAAAAAMLGDDIFDAVDEQTIAKTKSRACAVQ